MKIIVTLSSSGLSHICGTLPHVFLAPSVQEGSGGLILVEPGASVRVRTRLLKVRSRKGSYCYGLKEVVLGKRGENEEGENNGIYGAGQHAQSRIRQSESFT